MISKQSLKFIVYILRFNSYARFSPYDWDDKTKKLRLVSGKPLLIWWISVVLTLIYYSLKCVVFIYIVISSWGKLPPPSAFLVEFGSLLGFGFLAVTVANGVVHRNDLCQLFNKITQINHLLVVKLKKEDAKDGLELYFKSFFIVTIQAVVLITPFQILKEVDMQNIYSTFGGKSLTGKIIYHFVEWVCLSHLFFAALFQNYLLVGLVNSLNFWLNQIKHIELGPLFAEMPHSKFRRRVLIHQGLSLFIPMYRESTQTLVAFAYFALNILICVSAYLLIKHHGIGLFGLVLSLCTAFMSISLLSVCLIVAAGAQEKSLKFTRFLKNSTPGCSKHAKRSKIRTCLAESVIPIKFNVGPFFYVTRTTIFPTIVAVSNYLVTLLTV